eukprot:6384791-Lingulodinium_polyedra.AAC.1
MAPRARRPQPRQDPPRKRGSRRGPVRRSHGCWPSCSPGPRVALIPRWACALARLPRCSAIFVIDA